jgi:hypothetical protein
MGVLRMAIISQNAIKRGSLARLTRIRENIERKFHYNLKKQNQSQPSAGNPKH